MDVLVVTRGGGSIEDLWCFNEEPVVRAIFASRVPVVSAIGHEIDVTLSDLVADVRALTPTEAAQRVVPADRRDRGGAEALSWPDCSPAWARARRPPVHGSMRWRSGTCFAARWNASAIWNVVSMNCSCGRRVRSQQSVRAARQQVTAHASQLESLSPLGVLARGYSLTQRRRR